MEKNLKITQESQIMPYLFKKYHHQMQNNKVTLVLFFELEENEFEWVWIKTC